MKTLCIAGPTATGKTSLAIHISQLFPSLLISADSRQVYKDLCIVVGKDHPQNISLIGIDFLTPDQQPSVALWLQAIYPSLTQARLHNKLPIVVGGTGFYLHALIEGIETLNIPPNKTLRTQLAQKSVIELQEILRRLNPPKFAQLNNSDKHNPLRLIRAIEVAQASLVSPSFSFVPLGRANTLFLLLKPRSWALHKLTIRKRVVERLKMGAIEETKKLFSTFGPDIPAFSALGYRHLLAYLKGKTTYKELIENWTQAELSYAKRQITWFKKSNPDYIFTIPYDTAKIVNIVKTWYHKANE